MKTSFRSGSMIYLYYLEYPWKAGKVSKLKKFFYKKGG
jgi:hypothetical protein